MQETITKKSPASAILMHHLKMLYHGFNITMLGDNEQRVRTFINGLSKDFEELDRSEIKEDMQAEKVQQMAADIKYWKEEYEQATKYTGELMVLHKKVVAVFRDGLISAGLDFAAEPIQDYLDKL